MACSTGSGSGGNSEGYVVLATDSLVELSSFKKSNGELCKLRANVVVSYPANLKESGDSSSIRRLQQLFNARVLNVRGEVDDVKQAIRIYAKSLINSNTPSHAGNTRAITDTLDGDFDEIDIDKLESDVNIRVVYNDNGIISFVKEITIRKNDVASSVSHHYVNFDLSTMKPIGLNDLFNSDDLRLITQKLKAQLLSDKDAASDDELNDMGYFNLPNLIVTGNFFFTDDGITWSYDPSTIAVSSVGEPQITLSYSTLGQYACDNSILSRF